MEILKHGDLKERRFTCKTCGCEFVANMKEYRSSILYTLTYFTVKCPYCDKENCYTCDSAPLYKKDELDVIIDRTVRTDYDNWTHSMYCDWVQKQRNMR